MNLFGRRADKPEPEKPEPERTRFLPDGCANCVFSLNQDVEKLILCRRAPPATTVLSVSDGAALTHSHFPVVSSLMWCGEHRRRSS